MPCNKISAGDCSVKNLGGILNLNWTWHINLQSLYFCSWALYYYYPIWCTELSFVCFWLSGYVYTHQTCHLDFYEIKETKREWENWILSYITHSFCHLKRSNEILSHLKGGSCHFTISWWWWRKYKSIR